MYIKRVDGDEVGRDYYGILHKVIRLEFMVELIQKFALLHCEWFDLDVPRGLLDPKFTPIRRLIISDITESLTHSYLPTLQPKWYTFTTLGGCQEKRISG